MARSSRSRSPAARAAQAAGVTEQAPPAPVRLVVGIGASAGGLDAFQAFFSQMPADSGMAFVLVQHLDPHSRQLPDRRSSPATPRCRCASRRTACRCARTSLCHPAGRTPDDRGESAPLRPSRACRGPPRLGHRRFLVSLAQDQGENAVGIILSGFGSDGARGMVAIKEHGGLTLSQAEFDHHAKAGMPQSAASGGFVDHVLAGRGHAAGIAGLPAPPRDPATPTRVRTASARTCRATWRRSAPCCTPGSGAISATTRPAR